MFHKISNPQLISLFILTRMFSDCMNFPNTVAEYGMQRFTVTLLSTVITFLLYIPLIIFCLKKPDKSVFSIFAEKCPPLLYATGIPILFFLIFESIITGVQLDFFTTSTLMKTVQSYVILSLLTVVVIYCSAKGIQALARTAPIILVVFICFLIPASIYLLKASNFYYLYPAFIDNYQTFWSDILVDISKNCEIFVLLALCRYTTKKATRTIFIYIPLVLLLIEFMTFLSTVRLGSGINSYGFPYNRLATLVNIAVLERFDGIDLFIWVCAAILKITMYLLTSTEILSFIVKERTAKKITTLMAIGIGISSYYFSIYRHTLIVTDYSVVIISFMLLFAFISPIIGLFIDRRGNNVNKTDKNTDLCLDNPLS